jgi:hypothetical protein
MIGRLFWLTKGSRLNVRRGIQFTRSAEALHQLLVVMPAECTREASRPLLPAHGQDRALCMSHNFVRDRIRHMSGNSNRSSSAPHTEYN